MSRVQMWYLEPGGVFRRRWVPLRQQEPVSIVNNKDEQLHVLRGNPIFVKGIPRELDSLDQLLTDPPPAVPQFAEDRMCLSEEDNPWPIGMLSDPLTGEEQLTQLKSMRQEWIQKGKRKARRNSQGDINVGTRNTMIAVALTMGGLIAAIGIKIMIDSQDAAEVVATALLKLAA